LGIIPYGIILKGINIVMKTSPFRFGKVVTGEYFVNRKNEIKRIRSNVQGNINTILISPRRWGKSSLMHQIAQKTSDRRNKFVFIDFYNIRTEEEFYNVYAQQVLKASLTKTDEFLKAGKNFFRTIIPHISFSIDPGHDLSVRFNWNEVRKSKTEIIDLPETIARKKNIRLIVCIDEFQNIARLDNYIQIEEELRSCWQQHKYVAYCLYGSKRHMMLDIFNLESRPFYRFGDLIMLDKIQQKYWVSFIIKAFSNTGKIVTPSLAEKIVEFAGNHPDYIQQLCHHVWSMTENKVNDNIILHAIELVLSSNSMLYQKTCEGLSGTQLNLLKAVAGKESQFTSHSVMNQYALGTPRNVFKNKLILESKEIVDFHAENAYFVDPFFEYWFKSIFLKV
jgi:AAA+ ATPase superfamily predicted ATPase